MKKILFTLMFALTLSLAIPTTFAATDVDSENYEEALAIAEEANAKIEMLVNIAQFAAEHTDQDEVIIEFLITTTEKISQHAIEEIIELGFDAVCTYEPYVIDGQTVLIDPIKVLGW